LVGKAQRDGGQFYVGHKAKHPIGSMGIRYFNATES
jgi:hypothetical protein